MSVGNTRATVDRSPEVGKTVRDHVRMLRRRRIPIVVTALTIAAVGIATAFLWPAVYRSKATILIEEQEIPTDLVRSTITSYADQRIETIKQQVMSRGSLWRIVEQFGLYQSLRKRSPTEEVLQQFVKDIQIEGETTTVLSCGQSSADMASIADSDTISPAILAKRLARPLILMNPWASISTMSPVSCQPSVGGSRTPGFSTR